MTLPNHDTPVDRRTLGLLATGALLASVLPRTASAQATYDAARREGKLVLYTDMPGETIERKIALFKSRHPGIDVEFFRGDTTQVFQRFQTETAAGRHSVDALTSTVRRMRHMARDKMLASYQSPATANYVKDMNPNHGLWAVYALSLTSFAWNTRQVPSGQEPRSWEDLLNPRWKGKIGMQDPLQGGGVASWIATMYQVWGEARWTDYMTRLAAQSPMYGRYLPVQDALGGGEIAVMVAAYPDYVQATLKAKGAPVEWAVTNPVVRTPLATGVSANAPRPNAAKLWVDFLLSADAQKVLADRGALPALQTQWADHFARLKAATFVDPADELEEQRQAFFQAKMREFFGKR
jgi:iron(III) transport system substrate-binding protein